MARTEVDAAAPQRGGLVETVLTEVLRDSHRYVPGLEPTRPTINNGSSSRSAPVRERLRDGVERLAGRGGFSRRHFDPAESAQRLARILELGSGLEATYGRLADAESRRGLVELLKLRVLGPYHAPLAITPAAYRAHQAYADRELCLARATFQVSDPWFSPLSLYEAPGADGTPIRLHSHSVDVVSVFLLEQYRYESTVATVGAEAGDVVLDVGGCWGDTALYFASLVGPTGRVYTFEFDPESLEILRENLRLNPTLSDRIEVVDKALWDESGRQLSFIQGGRMTTVVDGNGGQSVSTITVDDFAREMALERVDVVKMDVEGAEQKVLRGAGGALDRFAPQLAIAAYHNDDDIVRLRELIEASTVSYRYFLRTSSPLEDETILFACASGT